MKAIIFDFDGVIHNTFSLSWNITKKINPQLTKERYLGYFEGTTLLSSFEKEAESQIIYRKKEAEAFKTLVITPEIKSELEKLNQRYDLYIISSNTCENLKTYCKNNGVLELFKDILGANVHKLKVKKFEMLFKNYYFDADSCIFITDTLGDILEANKVGVKSIACTFGFHDKERLMRGNPFRIVSNFKEIRKTIELL
jgi:phosphoglycolate phosphatase